jgi:hypothetical protein
MNYNPAQYGGSLFWMSILRHGNDFPQQDRHFRLLQGREGMINLIFFFNLLNPSAALGTGAYSTSNRNEY